MLADVKSSALVDNFAGQWLQLRNISSLRPTLEIFPDFDENLRQAFHTETSMFVESIVRGDRSAFELLTADYTFANERLARHYGIPFVKGDRFRRVSYPDDTRRGLLGHGSVLIVSSRPNRTSPVLRGKWILENIFGTPPPPPPPNVPALEESRERTFGPVASVRERMARHRGNPACAACHSMIDPPGFALENFDAVGRWRDLDESYTPIDASGVLPSGEKFANLAEFRAILIRHPERFVTTVTEKLLTYALGRGVDFYDQPAVRSIVSEASRRDFRFSALILGIVKSVPFQMRSAQS
jgi:hypothetical protein